MGVDIVTADALKRERDDAHEAIERWIKKHSALKRYAQHRIGCASFDGGPCDCGLIALLERRE